MRSLLRFSRHNAIGLFALFVALGGTSYAAVALPKNSVGSGQIKSNAVGSSEVRGSAIGSSELRRGAVGNSDLANGAVTGSKIRGNSIGSSKVAPGSLLASDFKAGELPKPASAPTSATPSGAAGGALTGSYPNPGLAAGSVTASTLGKLPAVRLTAPTPPSPTPAGTLQSIPSVVNPALSTGVRLSNTEYNNGGEFGVGAAADGGASLKVPVSGVYTVTAQVIWIDPTVTAPNPNPTGASGTQDNNQGTRSLFINGPQPGGVRASSTVQPAGNVNTGNPGTGTTTRQNVSTTEYFAAGDEIQLSAAQTSGAALSIRGSQNQVHFSATLLTP